MASAEPAPSARALASPGESLTILQLTHQGQGSGSTRSIADLSAALARRGHRVLVGCRAETLLADLSAAAGLEVVPLDFARLGPLAASIERLVRDRRPDVVNSHATRDRRALAWLRWRARLAAPLVVTRRTMPLSASLEVLAVGLAAERTIAVSEAVARALRRRLQPRARLRMVHNGLDLARVDARPSSDDLAAARAALGDPAGRRVVVIVARRKDQDVVLRALSSVRPAVLLALVGLEPDPELAALARALPERHRAVFVSFTDRALAFYRLGEAAALPSRIEGLSQGLLEAMALGLPVAASRAGGNLDLVEHGRTGLLVEPLDPRAWAAAIERLLGDPEVARELGEAGRRRVRSGFTLERTAARTEAVYREAIERRASTA